MDILNSFSRENFAYSSITSNKLHVIRTPNNRFLAIEVNKIFVKLVFKVRNQIYFIGVRFRISLVINISNPYNFFTHLDILPQVLIVNATEINGKEMYQLITIVVRPDVIIDVDISSNNNNNNTTKNSVTMYVMWETMPSRQYPFTTQCCSPFTRLLSLLPWQNFNILEHFEWSSSSSASELRKDNNAFHTFFVMFYPPTPPPHYRWNPLKTKWQNTQLNNNDNSTEVNWNAWFRNNAARTPSCCAMPMDVTL